MAASREEGRINLVGIWEVFQGVKWAYTGTKKAKRGRTYQMGANVERQGHLTVHNASSC